ncbi:hypothetical protein D9756_003423 [Leucocoprinus leucothites]|uniref:Calcineurin-like phosphoesterase domain-containing protein n=1 Tax=Leucocoprinus leucothites TaxID=201217 RepID=A0A8H5G731_9AGAR|nr:hypothetical protein D9756_003423 [Leucoagaricus leucothites]
MIQPRQFLVLLTLAVIAAFALGVDATLNKPAQTWRDKLSKPKHPDFKQYRPILSLSPDEFPTDDPERRVILIGDIHGMEKWFLRLLKKVAYDGQHDVLVHTGDILTRGRHKGSMRIVDFMTIHNVTGVRGNHDQKVIEWKGWLNWFNALPGASKWLAELESAWHVDHKKGHELKPWIISRRKASRGQDAYWWNHIPEDWVPFGDHYRVARDLKKDQYAYLLSLPLKLHIPSAHTFIVHAGLLPYDVRYDYDHKRQPLAHVPRLLSHNVSSTGTTETLRNLQELAILLRVPQNTEPWANLNLRSVLEDNSITKDSHEGTPWATYWNKQMDLCDGFHPRKAVIKVQDPNAISPLSDGPDKSLPCYPASVIHGHTASRGLDISRYSFGLDTGCVYGRNLTAMILGPNPLPRREEWEEIDYEAEDGDESFEDAWMDLDNDDYDDEYEVPDLIESMSVEYPRSRKRARTIKFGDHGQAKIVEVSCS